MPREKLVPENNWGAPDNEYQKINDNVDFDDARDASVDSQISSLNSQVQGKVETTTYNDHVNGTADRHGSDDVDNESGVVGNNVSEALDTIKAIVDNIETGDSNAAIGVYSIVDASNTNDYVGTYAGLTYFGGLTINLSVNNANDSAVTFTLNAEPTVDIKIKQGDGTKVALTGGEITGITQIEYDGVDFVVVGKVAEERSAETVTTDAAFSYPARTLKGTFDCTYEGRSIDQAGTLAFASPVIEETSTGTGLTNERKIDGTASYPNGLADVGGVVDDFETKRNSDYVSIASGTDVNITNFPTALDGGSYIIQLDAGGQETGTVGVGTASADGQIRFNLDSPVALNIEIKPIAVFPGGSYSSTITQGVQPTKKYTVPVSSQETLKNTFEYTVDNANRIKEIEDTVNPDEVAGLRSGVNDNARDIAQIKLALKGNGIVTGPSKSKGYESPLVQDNDSAGKIGFADAYIETVNTGTSSVNVTSMLKETIDKFLPGMQLTLVDDAGSELLIVDSVADPVVNFTSNIQGTYLDGANLYQSKLKVSPGGDQWQFEDFIKGGSVDFETPVQIASGDDSGEAVPWYDGNAYPIILNPGIGVVIQKNNEGEQARIDDANITSVDSDVDSINGKIHIHCNDGSTGAYVVIFDPGTSTGDLYSTRTSTITGQTAVNGVLTSIDGVNVTYETLSVNATTGGNALPSNRRASIDVGGNSVTFQPEGTEQVIDNANFGASVKVQDCAMEGSIPTMVIVQATGAGTQNMYYIRRDNTLSVQTWLDSDWTGELVSAAGTRDSASIKIKENGITGRVFIANDNEGSIEVHYSDDGGSTWNLISLGQGSNTVISENASGDIYIIYEYDGIGHKVILDGQTTAGAFVQDIADDVPMFRLGTQEVPWSVGFSTGNGSQQITATRLEMTTSGNGGQIAERTYETALDVTNIDKIIAIGENDAGAQANHRAWLFLNASSGQGASSGLVLQDFEGVGKFKIEIDVSGQTGVKYVCVSSRDGSSTVDRQGTTGFEVVAVPTENPHTPKKAFDFEKSAIIAGQPNFSDQVLLTGKWGGLATFPLTQVDVRMYMSIAEAANNMASFTDVDTLAGLTVDAKGSIVPEGQDESYFDMVDSSYLVGDGTEFSALGKTTDPNLRATLKLELSRNLTTDDARVNSVINFVSL